MFLQEIADKNTEVGRLVKAYEVEVLQTETCSVCVLSFRTGVSWRDAGNLRKCGVGGADGDLSLVGRHLLRVSSLGHWMALLISGFLLFKWGLTLTHMAPEHKITCTHSEVTIQTCWSRL